MLICFVIVVNQHIQTGYVNEVNSFSLESCALVSPGYGDTLCVAVLSADRFLQLIKLSRLLQFLHEALHSFFTPLFLLSSPILLPYTTPCSSTTCWCLLPSQEALHYWGSKRKDGGHGGVCMRVRKEVRGRRTTQVMVSLNSNWRFNNIAIYFEYCLSLGESWQTLDGNNKAQGGDGSTFEEI